MLLDFKAFLMDNEFLLSFVYFFTYCLPIVYLTFWNGIHFPTCQIAENAQNETQMAEYAKCA
jgi:hypothetical protein